MIDTNKLPARVQWSDEYLAKNPHIKQRQGTAIRTMKRHNDIIVVERDGAKGRRYIHKHFLSEIPPMPTEDQLDISLESQLEFRPDHTPQNIPPMSKPLPEEISKRIKLEAQAVRDRVCSKEFTEYQLGLSDGIIVGYTHAAESYCTQYLAEKERADQLEAILEDKLTGVEGNKTAASDAYYELARMLLGGLPGSAIETLSVLQDEVHKLRAREQENKTITRWKEATSLRELKDITDEDALEVYPILSSYPMTDENKIKNVKNLFKDFHSAQTNIPGRSWYKAFKYLEAKGYTI